MPFRPESVDPDFSKLLTILNKSKSKQHDTPMYQVVERLLDQLMKFKTNVNGKVAKIQEDIEEIAGGGTGGGGPDISDKTFLTVDPEQPDLPNSLQLIEGNGVDFVDTATTRAIKAELPVGSIHSTWINVNAGTLLGYGVWELFATGVKAPGTDITFTVY